jgi:hypothetical protein
VEPIDASDNRGGTETLPVTTNFGGAFELFDRHR